MKAIPATLFLLWIALSTLTPAETVKDREGAVRGDKQAMENDPRWIYNDLEKGFAESKKSGKPLLVALRCVPCLSCAGLDAAILQSKELTPLLEQFVCVRIINANNLDLSRFQFDYDLSFSTMFFHADGTIYGRFGSWAHQKDKHNDDLASYRATLEAILKLHAGYPANKDSLKAKTGAPLDFATPVDIPKLATKYGRELNWGGQVVQSCVHCHQIGDAFRNHYREKKQPIPISLIYPMPAPETIGLSLEPSQPGVIASLDDSSPLAKAGLKAGDRIVAMNGQAISSVADASWALDQMKEETSLVLQVQRNAKEVEVMVKLDPGWRRGTDVSTRVAAWGMRGMAFGGLVLEDLPDEDRKRLDLPLESMAMRVNHVGQYGEHAAAKNAGFQAEDIIVGLGDRTKRISESRLLGDILLEYQAGTKIDAAIIRNGKPLTLKLPVQ